MPNITPCLWFDRNAEEAVAFYSAVFKHSRITGVMHYGDAGPGPKGSVLSINFELEGQSFIALNGGPHYTFSPAISLFVGCTTQEEVDELWEKLSEGGEKQRCGWLKDKYGVSWQVVPRALGQMLSDQDAGKAATVMRAMLTMDKLDIAGLEQADVQS